MHLTHGVNIKQESPKEILNSTGINEVLKEKGEKKRDAWESLVILCSHQLVRIFLFPLW